VVIVGLSPHPLNRLLHPLGLMLLRRSAYLDEAREVGLYSPRGEMIKGNLSCSSQSIISVSSRNSVFHVFLFQVGIVFYILIKQACSLSYCSLRLKGGGSVILTGTSQGIEIEALALGRDELGWNII